VKEKRANEDDADAKGVQNKEAMNTGNQCNLGFEFFKHGLEMLSLVLARQITCRTLAGRWQDVER
jgi:hypothetical protein